MGLSPRAAVHAVCSSITVRGLFEKLDRSRAGWLTREDFVNGIRDAFPISAPQHRSGNADGVSLFTTKQARTIFRFFYFVKLAPRVTGRSLTVFSLLLCSSKLFLTTWTFMEPAGWVGKRLQAASPVLDRIHIALVAGLGARN